MPTFGGYGFKRRTWATMLRWQRKEWHREQESRARRGLARMRRP
jgi:hypothetical protein